MAKIAFLKTIPWPLPGNVRFVWYSPSHRGFVLGNHADKWIWPVDAAAASPLVQHPDPYAPKKNAWDPLLPDADYAELTNAGLDGFQFLQKAQYAQAFGNRFWGSVCLVDQTLISGLTNQLPVLHPATGSILSFADRRVILHELGPSGLATISEVKPPAGHAITALRGSSRMSAIFFGTNQGAMFKLDLAERQLGARQKCAEFPRVINSISEYADGMHLIAGGLGYLAMVSTEGSAGRIVAKIETSCGGFAILRQRWLLVNQGVNGMTLFDTANHQLRADAMQKIPDPADRLWVSDDDRYVLALTKPPGCVHLYELFLD